MALSQCDLLRLIESLRSSDGLELVRSVAERMLQELIEAEATFAIGAGWNEHTDTRAALRNGHRDRTLTAQAGDLDLAIPKLRSGSFFPAPLAWRRRIDQALYAVIMEAYVHGVSRFLRSLRERGLAGVRLVIGDHHSGLVKAIRKVMIGSILLPALPGSLPAQPVRRDQQRGQRDGRRTRCRARARLGRR